MKSILSLALVFALTACATTHGGGASVASQLAWPTSLTIIGDGYPSPGDPCRRVGESAATLNMLDDTRTLIGCPLPQNDPRVAALLANGGRVVGTIEGVVLISVPLQR